MEVAAKIDKKKFDEFKKKEESRDYYEWLDKRMDGLLQSNLIAKENAEKEKAKEMQK